MLLSISAACVHEFAIAQTFALEESRLGLPRVEGRAPAALLVALGRQLFFDRRLSADGSISCATCHDPQKAYSDGRRLAIGIANQPGTRNTPSLLNVAYQGSLFWDGRRDSLEAQAADPFLNAREHGFSNRDELLRVISSDAGYARASAAAFGTKTISMPQVTAALAAFERTLLAADSPFDRFYYGKDDRALSRSAQRGLQLFQGRAQCAPCHTIGNDGAMFTDGKFHTNGVGVAQIEAKLGSLAKKIALASDNERDQLITSDPNVAALGRFAMTRDPRDIGNYKTPSLRNVALTAPYMHDGSVPTLREAVDRELYYRSTQSKRPIVLTPTEEDDLIQFLQALTSPSWPLGQGESEPSVTAARAAPSPAERQVQP